jgi:alkylated DNA repair dioxygenase AlkB
MSSLGRAYGSEEYGFVFVVRNVIDRTTCDQLGSAMDKKATHLVRRRIQDIQESFNLPTKLRVIEHTILPIIQRYYMDLDTDRMAITNLYTVSRHYRGDEIDWHYDKKQSNERFKVCLYLGNNSGTYFAIRGTRNKYLHVRPSKGDVVVFDMRLEHRGAPIIEGVKKILGLRIGSPNVNGFGDIMI